MNNPFQLVKLPVTFPAFIKLTPAKPATLAQEVKQMIQDIPDARWMSCALLDDVNNRACFYGHMLRLASPNSEDYSVSNLELASKTKAMAISQLMSFELGESGPTINDGYHSAFQQRTPKARIMAALDELIARGK